MPVYREFALGMSARCELRDVFHPAVLGLLRGLDRGMAALVHVGDALAHPVDVLLAEDSEIGHCRRAVGHGKNFVSNKANGARPVRR